MEKPEDYSEYFNEDGTRKKVPYIFTHSSWGEWLDRQNEIFYSLMTDEKKACHRIAAHHWKDKMMA